jgi:Dolichyl-phosphate-mannose-protein mannosyltransferase
VTADRLRPVRRWNGEAIAIGLFAGIHTFLFFAREDRFSVLLWWTRESWPYVALLWAKDLVLGALAFFLFAEVTRASLALPEPDPPDRRSRSRDVVLFLAVLSAGVALRWIAPRQIPPGVWTDVLFEAEGALWKPGQFGWFGGQPFAAEANALVSNVYMKFCELMLHLFGRGDTGILALSAVGGTLALPAIYFLGRELGGHRRGMVAMSLTAFAMWPLVFSRWGYSVAILLPLVAGAAAMTLAALRRRSALLAVGGGVLLGLSLHGYPTAWAVAAGFAGFALTSLIRRVAPSRLVAAGAIGCLIAFAPFGVAYLEYPERIGGRPKNVALLTPARDPTVPSATGALAVPARLLRNCLDYTGLLLWTSDPNPRHGIPERPPVDPVLGVAAIAGAALGWRSARTRRPGDQLLLWIAGTSLAAGVLSNPGGAPNGSRIFPYAAAVLLWGAAALDRWIPAAAQALHVRESLLGSLALVVFLVVETGPFAWRWPDHPSVAGSFCPDESAAGRIRRELGSAPTLLAPNALGCPVVFETLAAGDDPARPVPYLPRASAADLVRSPPETAFWYVARADELDVLREAGWRISPKSRAEERERAVLVRAMPSDADRRAPAKDR